MSTSLMYSGMWSWCVMLGFGNPLLLMEPPNLVLLQSRNMTTVAGMNAPSNMFVDRQGLSTVHLQLMSKIPSSKTE